MNGIKGVILDMDGTLVDSNDAHALAWVEAFGKHDIQVPFEKIRPLIGMGGDKIIPRIGGHSNESPEGKQIARMRSEIFQGRYLPWVQPFPGVRALLARFKADGLKLALASSAEDEELSQLLRIAGVEDLVHRKASTGPGDDSKPDPDVVHSALKALGLPAEAVLMIGDTPYDVEAATRAGIRIIALRSGGWKDDQLAGAMAIYDDPADLLASMDRAPAASPPLQPSTPS
jgi:phosphoglycolate phosphatase-like HAD superfamily hydrolase